MREKGSKSIKSVTKTHEIIKCLLDTRGAGVSEIAAEVDLHPSTVHAHLSSLLECGLVVKERSEYSASLRFLEMGGRLRNVIPVYRKGRKEIEDLASKTGERTNIVVREGSEEVVIHMSEGEKAIEKHIHVGKRHRMHCTGGGKAILAELPEELVHEIVDDAGLPAMTANTITDRDELFDELKRIRERGYAIDEEELYDGVHCIATPICEDGKPVGAIGISGPTSRLGDEQYQTELRRPLLEAANVIELNLKFHG